MKRNNIQLLEHTQACNKGLRFMRGRSVAQGWAECEFGSWMVWWASRLYVNGYLTEEIIRNIFAVANKHPRDGSTVASRIRALKVASHIDTGTSMLRKQESQFYPAGWNNRPSTQNFTLRSVLEQRGRILAEELN